MFSSERVSPEILDYTYRKVIESHIKPRHLKGSEDLVDSIVLELMEKTPIQAFQERLAHQEGYIIFQGETDDERCENMQLELLSAHLTLPKGHDINIMMSSPGGSWEYGLTVMGVMHRLHAEGRNTNVHITGSAASMGSIITQAATRRYIDEFGEMMIHEAFIGGGTAKYREVEDAMVGNRLMHEAMYRIYASRSGKPPEYWEERVKRRDVFLTPQQALDEGLVDEIVYSPFTQG